jgi:type I restriction enzyme S subunit
MKAGWQTKTLGEVLQKTETVNPLQSPGTEFDYIDVSSISNTTFKIEATQRLKGKDAPSRARKLVRANDILFATIRPTLQRIAVVPEHLDKQVCSTGYFVLRPKPGIDHRFVFYFLFTENFTGQMESLQKGASYPAVTDGDVKAQVIHVPSLLEQQRIVGILDQAFDSITTAKANAKKNLQNARALFESHLQSVFTQRGEGWVVKTLEEVCIIGDGNHSSNYPRKDELVEAGVPFIRATNMVVGRISGSDMRFLSPQKHAQLKKGHLKTGDILITNRGEIGKTAIVDSDYDNANLNSQIAWLRCREGMDNKFLFHVLNSGNIQQHFESAKSGAALQQFTIKQLKALKVPSPPTPQQETIVEQLDALSVETQRLESLCQRKHAALDALKQSLLHQAFSGAL